MFNRIRRWIAFLINAVATVIGLMGVLCVIGTFLALGATVFVGAWDTAVWLFKADWRTTNFAVPIVAGIATVVLWVATRILFSVVEGLSGWADRLDPDLRPKDQQH